MHIVHVITKLDVGGAQTVVRELSEQQTATGHQVSVVTGTLGPVSQQLLAHGVEVHHLEGLRHSIDPIQDRKAGNDLQALLHSISPGVVHSHSSKTGLLGRRAARRLDLPSVYTAHGWPFQKGAPLKQRLLSWAGETSAGRTGGHIVCVTSADHRLAGKLRIAPADRIHLVKNGIGSELNLQPVPANRSAEFNVVMVARFASPKRHDLLVDALKLLPSRFTLTFVGDGPRIHAAQNRASTLGGRVLFAGAESPDKWLQAADAFVLVSDYEGLPMSVLEAMRAGLPVIANALPGVSDAVDFASGLTVRKQPIAIANAIRSLAADPELALRLGTAGYQRWRTQFTASTMATSYSNIYSLAAK